MAYRNGKRNQMTFLPSCIEEYVSPEDPVRAYDAFVEALDLSARGKNYGKKHYEKQLAAIDEPINKLLDECDRIDNVESEQESFVEMKKELKNSKTFTIKSKIFFDSSKSKNKREQHPKQ